MSQSTRIRTFYIHKFVFLYRIRYGLGASSDFFAFDQFVGSSNFDAIYLHNSKEHKDLSFYPVYHTSYETFSMMKKFIDPDFTVN